MCSSSNTRRSTAGICTSKACLRRRWHCRSVSSADRNCMEMGCCCWIALVWSFNNNNNNHQYCCLIELRSDNAFSAIFFYEYSAIQFCLWSNMSIQYFWFILVNLKIFYYNPFRVGSIIFVFADVPFHCVDAVRIRPRDLWIYMHGQRRMNAS